MEAKPIAQASVLRWVLMGGISADSGRLFLVCSSVRMPLFPRVFTGGGVVERVRAGGGWFSCLAHCWVLRQQGRFLGGCVACEGCVVFLGAGFVCFWFPGCMSCACPAVLLFWGVVGVWGCGTGLLFENYIVDASI